MLSRAIEQIHYEHYCQLLQMLCKPSMVFAVFDGHGRCLWSNQDSNGGLHETILDYVQNHPHHTSELDINVASEVLNTDEIVYLLGVQSASDESQVNLIALMPATEAVRESDATTLIDAMRVVGMCLRNEIQLNTELENMADELSERYEELNLVYEADNQELKTAHGQESLRRLVSSCTDFLDVGMTALLMPDKRITIYDFNQSTPILNPAKLLMSLKQDLYGWLQSHNEPVVINSVQCAQSYNVHFDIPYKLLISPVDSGEQEIIGMLVIVNHTWKPDFTNSDRNILDVMAKKVTKIVQAHFDTLTGLENNQSFEWSLQEALKQAHGKDISHTLLSIDLDSTGVVNDISGREAGDALIRLVGQTVSKMVRHRDVVARLGGDEFGVLLDSCPLNIAATLAQNISQKISELKFEWEGKQHDVSACIGVAPITTETESIAGLVSSVEVARRAAKERGNNRIQVFEQNDIDLQRRREQIKWVGHVQEALREDRFQLYAQLIQSLSDKNDSHYEILLRMLGDNGSLISPIVFMPAAERYNLMPKIDRWVIRKTFDELRNAGQRLQNLPVSVSINLSGQSLSDDGFCEFVIHQLEHLGDYRRHICFEITESSAIGNLTDANQFISQIKAIGCRFSLDDFGTGLSSFAYLQNMNVDFLKIDGSFVRKLDTDAISETMVSAINQVGHAMGLKTIAEYVENEEIIRRLKAMGVDYGQGYALGKPQPFLHCLGEFASTQINSSS